MKEQRGDSNDTSRSELPENSEQQTDIIVHRKGIWTDGRIDDRWIRRMEGRADRPACRGAATSQKERGIHHGV